MSKSRIRFRDHFLHLLHSAASNIYTSILKLSDETFNNHLLCMLISQLLNLCMPIADRPRVHTVVLRTVGEQKREIL